ncbi:hypothetical protein [Legionella shakespearei]|uniref:Uncharacterized protein n=1 Tax=Legionella shakespearei DSM 23087 TaxID=1122169 RepID=A0A0W0YLZ4_9GAMM|nr:hypothetical protein [Legionella shakespearei]KTD57901.1 hypothetical protein Lsha_2179 [Legionella shakespearei DSM 23087]
MTLTEALTILGLSELFTPENLMVRYIQKTLSFSKAELSEESGRTRFEAVRQAYLTAVAQLGNKSVKDIDTVGQYLDGLTRTRMDLNTHQIELSRDTRLNEVTTLYMTIPVDVSRYSMSFDDRDFDLAQNVAGKGRYWNISDKEDSRSSAIDETMTREKIILSHLQVDGIGHSPVRLIPGFLRYEFRNITPKIMIDAFFSDDLKAVIPYLSSVTTHRLSAIEEQHYPVLSALFARLRTDGTKAAEQIMQYVKSNLGHVTAPAEPKEITKEITEEHKNRILRRLHNVTGRNGLGMFERVLLDEATTGSASATTATTPTR